MSVARPPAGRAAQLATLSLALLAACGGGAPAPTPARPIEDPGYVVAGDYTLYYAANLTGDLPATVLDGYGLAPAPNRALVSLAVLRRNDDAPPRPVRAAVQVSVRTLTGEPRALAVREISGAGGPSYVATFETRHREFLVIELSATPVAADGPAAPLTARLPREFWLE